MKQLTLEHLLSRKRPARSDETRPRTRARVQACIAPVEALGAAANVGDVHMDDQPGALASTGGAGGAQVEVLSGAMPKRLNEGVGVARIGGGEEGGGGKGEEKVGRRPARRKTQASTVLDWAGGLPAAARTGGGSGGRSGRAARRAAVKERISDDGVGVVSVERRVQPRRSSRSARSALGPDDGAAVGVDVGESAVTVESVVAEKSSVMDGSAMEAVTIPKLPSLSASLRARELGLFTSSLSSDYVGALVCCREAAKPPLTVTSTYDGSDDFVSKVYAMAISNLGSEVRVAAGGHGGRFIVLKAPFEPVGNAEGNPRRGNRDAWDEAAEMNAEHDERNSILWWSDAHSPSWISDLCFNSPANVLVSSGNDGFLRCHNAFTGDPLSEIVHTTAGVYSMDVYGESSIASVAKDGSLLFSRLAGSTIRGEDVRVGAHKGVAKCVRWRWDGQLVITSGNDRCVRLFDKRDGSRAVSIVEDAHSLGKFVLCDRVHLAARV